MGVTHQLTMNDDLNGEGLGVVRCLILVILLLAHAAPAQADKRVALVIGNGAYQYSSHLENPAHDATDMASVLARVGFDVVQGIDADFSALQQLMREFTIRAGNADVALLFFAGHGLQVDGENYLLPVSARLQRRTDLRFEAVALNEVLHLMEESGARIKIAVVDACRDNPLARSFNRSTRSTVGSGLAPPRSTARGTLIAFATSPGDVAADGSERNSPFTAALLRHLPEPNVEVNEMFTRVRAAVDRTTGGEQLPWLNTSLVGQFYFSPGQLSASQITAIPPPEPEGLQPARLEPPRSRVTEPHVEPSSKPQTQPLSELDLSGHTCAPAVERALQEHGLSLATTTEISWETDRDRGDPGQPEFLWPISGYRFYGRPSACTDGRVVVYMNRTCGVSDLRTRGDCEIDGIASSWFPF